MFCIYVSIWTLQSVMYKIEVIVFLIICCGCSPPQVSVLENRFEYIDVEGQVINCAYSISKCTAFNVQLRIFNAFKILMILS